MAEQEAVVVCPFALEELRRRADNDERELIRGWVVLMSGKCRAPTFAGGAVRLEVEGSRQEIYQTELQPDLDGTCSCVAFDRSGEQEFCKHLAAAGFLWLRTAGVAVSVQTIGRDVAARLRKLSPDDLLDLLVEASAMEAKVSDRIYGGRWR